MYMQIIKHKLMLYFMNFSLIIHRVTTALFRNMVNLDTGLLCAIFIVVLIWALNSNALPIADAAAEIYTKQIPFAQGDLEKYLDKYPQGDHPLGRIITLTIFLKIFGFYAFATTLPGMLLNVSAVSAIFYLCKQYGNLNCARIASIMLACDPIFIATSLHTLPDHFMTTFLLVACYAYAKDKMGLWAIALIMAVLTKESALLLVIAFIVQWFVSLPYLLKEHKKIVYDKLIIPILILVLFKVYLKLAQSFGIAPWNYGGKTGFSTAWDNLLAFHYTVLDFWHGNALRHLSLLLATVFNFQWLINGLVYWWFVILIFKAAKSKPPIINTTIKRIVCVVAMIAISLLLFCITYFLFNWRQYALPIMIFVNIPLSYFAAIFIVDQFSRLRSDFFNAPFFAVILFSVAYIFLVLTYNTFANPRYVLPISIFMIIPVAFFINFLSDRIRKSIRYFLYIGGLVIIIIRFFVSADPVTNQVTVVGYPAYNKALKYGQIIYSSPQQVFDSEVYNGQFLFMVDNWTKELRAQRNNGTSSEIFY